MNFAEIDTEEDTENKVLLMNTYDRLIHLRNILETDEFQPKEIPEDVISTLTETKKTYLALVEEVLVGYMKLQPKKEKASMLLSFIQKFGNKDIEYVSMLHTLVEQFDADENITETALDLKMKTEKMLGYKKVFDLCADADIMSRYMCFLCLERPITSVIDPCGHVVCEECSQRTQICPFCRRSVQAFRKMYLA